MNIISAINKLWGVPEQDRVIIIIFLDTSWWPQLSFDFHRLLQCAPSAYYANAFVCLVEMEPPPASNPLPRVQQRNATAAELYARRLWCLLSRVPVCMPNLLNMNTYQIPQLSVIPSTGNVTFLPSSLSQPCFHLQLCHIVR